MARATQGEVSVIRDHPENPEMLEDPEKPKKWKFKILSAKNSSTVLRKTNYDYEVQVSTNYTRANQAPDIVIPVELFQKRRDAEGMIVTKKIPYKESQLATSGYKKSIQISMSDITPANA